VEAALVGGNPDFHRCHRTDADQEETAAAGFEKFHRQAELTPQDLGVSASAVSISDSHKLPHAGLTRGSILFAKDELPG
jgi:hypothetical protein